MAHQQESPSSDNEIRNQIPTLMPGFTPVPDGGRPRRSEDLPEVYVETSPETVHKKESVYYEKQAVLQDETLKSPVYPEDDHSAASPGAPGSRDGGKAPLYEPAEAGMPPGAESGDRKILGLSRRTFWIVLAVALIVIAAAIGGGVGGAIGSRSTSDSDTDKDNAEESPTATSSTISVTSTSTTSTPTPEPTIQFLNNQTTPSSEFGFQAFSGTNYTGEASEIIDQTDGTNFDFTVNSYVWLPNTTHCCLTFCQNATDKGMVGWLCDERFQNDASDAFSRIFIWCGLDRTVENALCK